MIGTGLIAELSWFLGISTFASATTEMVIQNPSSPREWPAVAQSLSTPSCVAFASLSRSAQLGGISVDQHPSTMPDGLPPSTGCSWL